MPTFKKELAVIVLALSMGKNHSTKNQMVCFSGFMMNGKTNQKMREIYIYISLIVY